MVRFSDFDSRHYPMVDVRTGYTDWSETYDQTVEDAMDIGLLEELAEPAWPDVRRAADLGCGTGRTGAWLRGRGVASIDGVDLTPAMLAVARSREVYDRLLEADVAASGLESGAYDLIVACLVDDHLPDLEPLYREAWRLAEPGAAFMLVGYHPHFIMATGIPTHYDSRSGEPVALPTHVHLLSEQVTAGLEAGWTLVEMRERLVDEQWLALRPNWERFLGHPVSMALVWRKPG